MAKKSKKKNRRTITARKRSGLGKNLLLTLTLVPLIIGVLLIGAWVLDILVLDDFQAQITVGVLFFLLSFAASNALQKRWRLAAGWGLLMCADLVLWAWLEVWAQVTALGVGLIGLVLLVIEFYKQYQAGRAEKPAG
jgi:hypothetical protein